MLIAELGHKLIWLVSILTYGLPGASKGSLCLLILYGPGRQLFCLRLIFPGFEFLINGLVSPRTFDRSSTRAMRNIIIVEDNYLARPHAMLKTTETDHLEVGMAFPDEDCFAWALPQNPRTTAFISFYPIAFPDKIPPNLHVLRWHH